MNPWTDLTQILINEPVDCSELGFKAKLIRHVRIFAFMDIDVWRIDQQLFKDVL